MVRCFAALALRRGYIHPDEWHQSCEPAAAALRLFPEMRQASLAWEFTAEQPARSALVPALACGAPLLVLRLLRVAVPAAVVAAPRLALALAAGVGQRAAERGAGACGASAKDAKRAGVAFATAWPALVLLPRPLSNSLEALCLAATLRLALPPAGRAPSRHALFALGVVAAVGAFCRFTFPLFAAPLHLLALWRAAAAQAQAARPRAAAASAARSALLLSLLCVAAGFAAGGAACAALDAAYYGRPVLTPLNRRALSYSFLIATPVRSNLWRLLSTRSLRYNAASANLAQHGLHPRFLHAAVNVPMLFAPLAPPAAAAFLAALRSLLLRPAKQRSTSMAPLQPPGDVATSAALSACVLLPLAALSAAPHQEPRFLLPMLLPLASLGGAAALASRRRIAAWIAFNAALALFWGGAHQAGVLPASAFVSDIASQWPAGGDAALALARSPHAPMACGPGEALAVSVTFWRTYPPPRALLRGVADVADLMGASPEALNAALKQSSAPCGCAARLLVAPALAQLPSGADGAALLARFSPHFSGEDAGEAFAAIASGAESLSTAFGLALYALPCRS